MTSNTQKDLKIALACPGVGLVQRGFERLFNDIFHQISSLQPITQYKGGGIVNKDEKIPLFLPRNGLFLKYVPLHWLLLRTRMHVECLTFALGMLPDLKREKYDIIHVIDPPLARILFHFRSFFGLSYKLLYTEGTAMPPGDYPPADHIHQISPVTYDQAARFGHSEDRMTLLPCGIHPEQFSCESSQEALKKKHGIHPDTMVITSVAALNRYHKRIDYLVDEVASLEGDILLWLDGSMDHGDPDLPDVAKQKLGDRCRITHLPSAQIGELYNLSDIVVLASKHEAFGLVVPEAMSTDTPVLTHNSEHFNWLVGHTQNLIDMSKKGELTQRLQSLIADPLKLEHLKHGKSTCDRLGWDTLKHDYLDLYQKVYQSPQFTKSDH